MLEASTSATPALVPLDQGTRTRSSTAESARLDMLFNDTGLHTGVLDASADEARASISGRQNGALRRLLGQRRRVRQIFLVVDVQSAAGRSARRRRPRHRGRVVDYEERDEGDRGGVVTKSFSQRSRQNPRRRQPVTFISLPFYFIWLPFGDNFLLDLLADLDTGTTLMERLWASPTRGSTAVATSPMGRPTRGDIIRH